MKEENNMPYNKTEEAIREEFATKFLTRQFNPMGSEMVNSPNIIQDPDVIADFFLSFRQKELKELYSWLVSVEARIAKEGVNSDYKNGYFEAIDDLAKHLSTLTNETNI